MLLCTSKLGVGLFDVAQSCDQLLAGDWLLVLQQVPVTANTDRHFHIWIFVQREPLGCSRSEEDRVVPDGSLPLCYKPQLIGQYVGVRCDSCHAARHVSARKWEMYL